MTPTTKQCSTIPLQTSLKPTWSKLDSTLFLGHILLSALISIPNMLVPTMGRSLLGMSNNHWMYYTFDGGATSLEVYGKYSMQRRWIPFWIWGTLSSLGWYHHLCRILPWLWCLPRLWRSLWMGHWTMSAREFYMRNKIMFDPDNCISFAASEKAKELNVTTLTSTNYFNFHTTPTYHVWKVVLYPRSCKNQTKVTTYSNNMTHMGAIGPEGV